MPQINTFLDLQGTKALTRAEAISVLDRAVGLLYKRTGTYGPLLTITTIEGNVTITTGEITLKNMVITGNLYLTKGIEIGQLTLDNVQIQGATKISGGTKINLTQETKLHSLPLDTPTTITGEGTVETAYINTSGVTLEIKPTQIEVAEGVDFKLLEPSSSSSSKKKNREDQTDRTAPTFAVETIRVQLIYKPHNWIY